MRDNAGHFEEVIDAQDARLNDGNNYKGLMNCAAYKQKRAEMAVEPEVLLQQKVALTRTLTLIPTLTPTLTLTLTLTSSAFREASNLQPS